MPVLRRLTEQADIDEFVSSYERASGYRVPLDYLHRGLVFGMRRRGRLIGGVVITGEPPLRTLIRVPEADRAAVAAAFDERDAVELTCLWIDRAHRSGWRSALFWYGLFLETGRRGVRHVLFGTESESLHRMYLLGRPRIVYSGRVTVDGATRHAVGSRNFDTPDNSCNNHVGAWLIWGEGLQNNHHANPGSAKFSYHWWEADFGWLVARTLERIGAVRVNRAGLIPRLVTDHIIPQADPHHLADGCPAQARPIASYSAGGSRQRRRQPSAR